MDEQMLPRAVRLYALLVAAILLLSVAAGHWFGPLELVATLAVTGLVALRSTFAWIISIVCISFGLICALLAPLSESFSFAPGVSLPLKAALALTYGIAFVALMWPSTIDWTDAPGGPRRRARKDRRGIRRVLAG